MERHAAKSIAGIHHPRRLHRRRLRSFPLAGEMELPRQLHLHRRRGVLCLFQILGNRGEKNNLQSAQLRGER